MVDWFRVKICDLFHGGGDIRRDVQGRINWRCRKCGRWSDHPVPLEEESRIFEMSFKKDEQ